MARNVIQTKIFSSVMFAPSGPVRPEHGEQPPRATERMPDTVRLGKDLVS